MREALLEPDERKLVVQIGHAINALQMRFAEWGDAPGSPEELAAILRSIRELDGVLSKALSPERH